MLAKSDGLSLEEHIQDLIDVSKELRLAFPALKELSENDDFWEFLKLSILFHDAGKATKGFQNLMNKNEQYRFRHEVISAIVAQNYIDNELIINAILAHHKNFSRLKELLKEYENNKRYNQDRWIEKEFEELDIDWIKKFWVKITLEDLS